MATEGLTVLDALEPHRGRRAFLEPLDGNHGDELILRGAQHWLAPLDLDWQSSPESAEVIVINGGGGLFAQPWCGDLTRLRVYTQGYRSTPIVVLPSSYYWGDHDLAGCFADRSAPIALFARETLSLDRLNALDMPPGVQVAIDTDMAFRLQGSPLIEAARQVPCEGYVLLVERFDEEQATGKPLRIKGIRKYGKHLPKPAQDLAKKMLDRVRFHSSGFRETVLQEALAISPEFADLPVLYNDVSNVTRHGFDEFIRLVAAAKAVVTTRMHAGILAAMLDKPTFVKGKAGPYRKLQAVYEYSMAEMPHVHLLS